MSNLNQPGRSDQTPVTTTINERSTSDSPPLYYTSGVGVPGIAGGLNNLISQIIAGTANLLRARAPPTMRHQDLQQEQEQDRRRRSKDSTSTSTGSGAGQGLVDAELETEHGDTNSQRDYSGLRAPLAAPQAILDPAEFPKLTTSVSEDSPSDAGQYVGLLAIAKPYVELVKQSQAHQVEFSMSSEDFPALSQDGASNISQKELIDNNESDGHSSMDNESNGYLSMGNGSEGYLPSQESQASQDGDLDSDFSSVQSSAPEVHQVIRVSPEGKITNIPIELDTSPFGLASFYSSLINAHYNPLSTLAELTRGYDLAKIGDMTPAIMKRGLSLCSVFKGPLAIGDSVLMPEDFRYRLFPEYDIFGSYQPHLESLDGFSEFSSSPSMRDILRKPKFHMFDDSTLFYIFFTFTQDILQLLAANELYNRKWRYHIDAQIWIAKPFGVESAESTLTYETGVYYIFDAYTFTKIPWGLHIEYARLEGRPILPPGYQVGFP